MIGVQIVVVVFVVLQWKEVTAATKPNILMFVMDDLGWNDTSYKLDLTFQHQPLISLPVKEFACSNIMCSQFVLLRDPPYSLA